MDSSLSKPAYSQPGEIIPNIVKTIFIRAWNKKHLHQETAIRKGHIHLCGHDQGAGRVCQQTFVDTYSKGGMRKTLHDKKTPVATADLLNDKVLPFVCSP